MQAHEIEIPVPWGIIAAKTWGNAQDPLVIAVHGWTDNANSFNTLIPLLPNSYYYCCIDLPFHGKSSDLQASLLVHHFDFVLVIKLIHQYFVVKRKQRKFIYMNHSIGGYFLVNFAQLYPECVSKLIMFDVFHYYITAPKVFFREILKHKIDNRVNHLMRKNTKERTYEREEAITRIANHRMTPILTRAAEILAERCLQKTDDGKYRFRTSEMTKYCVRPLLSPQDILELVQNFPIKCPHLIILSSDSSGTINAYKNVLKEYRKNKCFEFHVVTGSHQVHLETPEVVAPIVIEFLTKYESKL